ncbi:MAG: hypothetical protein K2X66_19035 [Cyanobacteria bacterium]|nr:hypothetical protein [Cyanobacteriota bacterium]
MGVSFDPNRLSSLFQQQAAKTKGPEQTGANRRLQATSESGASEQAGLQAGSQSAFAAAARQLFAGGNNATGLNDTQRVGGVDSSKQTQGVGFQPKLDGASNPYQVSGNPNNPNTQGGSYLTAGGSNLIDPYKRVAMPPSGGAFQAIG